VLRSKTERGYTSTPTIRLHSAVMSKKKAQGLYLLPFRGNSNQPNRIKVVIMFENAVFDVCSYRGINSEFCSN